MTQHVYHNGEGDESESGRSHDSLGSALEVHLNMTQHELSMHHIKIFAICKNQQILLNLIPEKRSIQTALKSKFYRKLNQVASSLKTKVIRDLNQQALLKGDLNFKIEDYHNELD